MVRTALAACAVALFVVGGAMAQQKTQDQKQTNKDQKTKASIVKVDKANHTITVRMKDQNGKNVEKTFKLAEDIRMLDEKGDVAAIDVFQSGNDVLVVEREGKLHEIQKAKKGSTDTKKPGAPE